MKLACLRVSVRGGCVVAAQLRGSLSLASLAESNLEWVVGRNPFVESLMWGEGYDYAPQYSAMSGDIVGSLPVGIQSHGNSDAPYWPTENCHNWKEVWVHPTGRWMWILRDLAGAPVVEGVVERGSGEPITFRDAAGTVTSVEADGSGRFRAALPEGEYEIANGTQKLRKALLLLTQQSEPNGAVTVRAVISGRGDHKFAIRADNLIAERPEQTLSLKAGVPYTLVWRARVANRNAPWTAVVIPDGDLIRRQELTAALTGSGFRK